MMKIFTIAITFLFCLYILPSSAQCSAYGPLGGSVTSNNASVGTVAWNATGNACSSDNSRAVANAILIGDKTNYLVITGFGFNITSPADICGITVEVEGSASGILQVVKDNSVKIVKGGVITGTDKAGSATWPNSDAFSSYGSNSDLWGTTWTEADINASNFGVAISANLTSLSALPSALIDFVRITVYYQSTLPITLLNFNAVRAENNTVKLSWETQVEINNDFFTIERSLDGINWDEVGRLAGAGTSEALNTYSLIDQHSLYELTYYRLKQTDYDGSFVYSKVVDVSAVANKNETFEIYPNPFLDELIIDYYQESEVLDVLIIEAESGKKVIDCKIEPLKRNVVNTSKLEKGIYFITIKDGNSVNKTIKFIKSN